MEQDIPVTECVPCKELGFSGIKAIYKEVKAGASHTGKRIPPMCYDHKIGVVPKHVKVNDSRDNDKRRNVIDTQVRLPELIAALTLDQIKQARELRLEGKTLNEIAKLLDVQVHRVQIACSKDKWQDRPNALDKDKAEGKWTSALKILEAMKIGDEKIVWMPVDGTINNFRCMVSGSRKTSDFKWSIMQGHPDKAKVIVTKLALIPLTDAPEELNDVQDNTETQELPVTDEVIDLSLKDFNIDEVKKLNKEGLSAKEIGVKLGVSHWRIRNVLSPNHWSNRQANIKDDDSKVDSGLISVLEERIAHYKQKIEHYTILKDHYEVVLEMEREKV